jgi:hypothetical protein
VPVCRLSMIVSAAKERNTTCVGTCTEVVGEIGCSVFDNTPLTVSAD